MAFAIRLALFFCLISCFVGVSHSAGGVSTAKLKNLFISNLSNNNVKDPVIRYFKITKSDPGNVISNYKYEALVRYPKGYYAECLRYRDSNMPAHLDRVNNPPSQCYGRAEMDDVRAPGEEDLYSGTIQILSYGEAKVYQSKRLVKRVALSPASSEAKITDEKEKRQLWGVVEEEAKSVQPSLNELLKKHSLLSGCQNLFNENTSDYVIGNFIFALAEFIVRTTDVRYEQIPVADHKKIKSVHDYLKNRVGAVPLPQDYFYLFDSVDTRMPNGWKKMADTVCAISRAMVDGAQGVKGEHVAGHVRKNPFVFVLKHADAYYPKDKGERVYKDDKYGGPYDVGGYLSYPDDRIPKDLGMVSFILLSNKGYQKPLVFDALIAHEFVHYYAKSHYLEGGSNPGYPLDSFLSGGKRSCLGDSELMDGKFSHEFEADIDSLVALKRLYDNKTIISAYEALMNTLPEQFVINNRLDRFVGFYFSNMIEDALNGKEHGSPRRRMDRIEEFLKNPDRCVAKYAQATDKLSLTGKWLAECAACSYQGTWVFGESGSNVVKTNSGVIGNWVVDGEHLRINWNNGKHDKIVLPVNGDFAKVVSWTGKEFTIKRMAN